VLRLAAVPFALVASALLLGAPPAQALQGAIPRAAQELRADPVYVDPSAERAISRAQAARLREEIRRRDAGPLYIAVLPGAAVDEAGGDAEAALRELALSAGEPGTYAALIGDSLRAGATNGVLPPGRAGELAAEALRARGGEGTTAVLSDFVGRVGEARRGGSGDPGGGSGGGGFPWLLGLLGLGGVLLALRRLRRRGEERRELAEVKDFARDDLVALGDEVRALDLDMEMPQTPAAAKRHYERAVELYERADDAWDRARRPEDLEAVSARLEEGRYEMTAARALLEGKPEPERRPPCFFDPRHGPSATDLEWAPPGGAPRPVPVCAADAQRIADGADPAVRQVGVGGALTPYWNAGPAYAPWAGGFFGGGLLPGLFLGSMLGGGFGLYGAGIADAATGDDLAGAGDFGGGFDDIGGGDFGGDFGGGDLGGGGDF
jgi:hypothetical protein